MTNDRSTAPAMRRHRRDDYQPRHLRHDSEPGLGSRRNHRPEKPSRPVSPAFSPPYERPPQKPEEFPFPPPEDDTGDIHSMF